MAASIGILGYGGSWFLYTPAIPWLQTIASGTMGLAAAGLWMLHGSIGADVIDYDELAMGIRRDGFFTACGSYVFKLGNSMGGFVAGLILGALAGGYIVKNNKDKAFAALDRVRQAAQDELTRLKAAQK